MWNACFLEFLPDGDEAHSSIEAKGGGLCVEERGWVTLVPGDAKNLAKKRAADTPRAPLRQDRHAADLPGGQQARYAYGARRPIEGEEVYRASVLTIPLQLLGNSLFHHEDAVTKSAQLAPVLVPIGEPNDKCSPPSRGSHCACHCPCVPQCAHTDAEGALRERHSIILVTTFNALIFPICSSGLKCASGRGVAELSERQKRLHFCRHFTLQ
jgi:hypothetical protein